MKIKINENFKKIKPSYLFSDIGKKVRTFSIAHPDLKIIRLGIGEEEDAQFAASGAEEVGENIVTEDIFRSAYEDTGETANEEDMDNDDAAEEDFDGYGDAYDDGSDDDDDM